MAKVLADYEIRHEQFAGEVSIGGAGVWWLNRAYDYKEFDVPYTTRLALYAETPLGTLLTTGISGTCTGVKDNGTTTVTSTTASFGDDVDGKDIVITDIGTFTINSRTSMTVIVVAGDATCTAKAFTIATAAPLTSQYVAHRAIKHHRTGLPGRSTIRAWYATPQWYRPDATQPIRGKVYIDRTSTKERMTVDVDGNPCLGPIGVQANDLKGETWELTDNTVGASDGEAYIWVPRTKYRLICAATDDWDPATIEDLIGKVNNATALGSAAGKLLFIGTREQITVFYSGSPLHQVELMFLRNPLGWNNMLKAVVRQKKVALVSVFNSTGTAISGETARVVRTVDIGNTPATRKGYAEASFALFNAMVEL